MMNFRDVLYGEIEIPDWLGPFLRLPELVRLRGVRMSNIDSLQYKDFGTVTRYDHALGVVYLASRIATLRRLNPTDTVHLILAALLHDVGTPPFGHTLEIVFDDIDHEQDARNALGLEPQGQNDGFDAVSGELPQFIQRCAIASKSLGFDIRPELVIEMINGQGAYGFFIKGSIDLDNVDNVLRGAHCMGMPSSERLPEAVATWLSAFDSQPSLEGPLPHEVREWIVIRDEYYRLFFDCNDDEKARQALLQFLIREAYRLGFPRESMLRTTDDGLINIIYEFANKVGNDAEILAHAVHKYRRLDQLPKVAEIPINAKPVLDAFRVKASLTWLESHLRQPGFVPILFYAKRRFPDTVMPKGSLFGYPAARLTVFALYEPKRERPGKSVKFITDADDLQKSIVNYAGLKPWRQLTERSTKDLKESLNAWGSWSFIGSRNESLHTYPSTFVHAIPAAFIKSLRLAGGTILDPFCGSGVTGIEAIKHGCRAVCGDINEVALLISKVRSTYIHYEDRERLREINLEQIISLAPSPPPMLDNLYKWHHPRTVEELCKIITLTDQYESSSVRDFIKLCMSSILTATTARRGKEHGWFADNTPLPRGELAPAYVDACEMFLSRIKRNLDLLERTYSVFERRQDKPEDALSMMHVVKASASTATAEQFSLTSGSVDGIITSPPYLCMADYSLGQRLSYAWLFPDALDTDFGDEIGARRRRNNSSKALEDYLYNMDKFAQICGTLVRQEGFVALVMGAPEAANFRDKDILKSVEKSFINYGFNLLWEAWRPINWHRNHGYERLKKEKLTVFVR